MTHRRGGPARLGGQGFAIAAFVVAAVLVGSTPVGSPAAARAADDTVRILLGPAGDLDPASQGDIGSAAVTAQLFETLTAIDAQLQTRPALAESWEFRDEGATVVFHLRPGISFSDGSPITADDVVRSWLRIIDPARPSPLVSLIGDVQGALEYVRGAAGKEAVGLTVEDGAVVAHLTRPGTDFPTIVSGPTFAIVPPALNRGPAALGPGNG
ncbi:MAG TPA: ABC transporter substrate-binding protein, partial [Candidatus Limnocylindrales bacterium]